MAKSATAPVAPAAGAFFSVRNNILYRGAKPVTQQRSPNYGRPMTPTLLVMHYTAGQSAQGAISWLCNPAAKASAHLVIDQKGDVTQLVPLNVAAWHAGVSTWKKKANCNAFSIGVELVNPGWLTKTAAGTFVDVAGKVVPADKVTIATHKNETAERPWMLYPAEQLTAAADAARAICEAYGIKEIVGHEDVAPGRKTDPGPAFPMQGFVSRVFGRR